MALSGTNTTLEWTGSATTWTDESCSVLSGTSNQDWEIDDATKDVWDWTDTFTVEVSEDDGSTYSTLNTDEYTLRYLIGVVQLDNLNSGTVTSNNASNVTDVRIDGGSYDQHTVLKGRSGGFNITNDLDDTATELGDTAMRRIIVQTDTTATIEQLEVSETPIDGSGGSESSIEDYADNGTVFVYSFDEGASSTTSKLRAIVLISGLSHEGIAPDSTQLKSVEVSMDLQDSSMSSQPQVYRDVWDY